MLQEKNNSPGGVLMGILYTPNIKRRLIALVLFLAVGIAFAIGMIKPHTATKSFQDEVMEAAVIPEEPQPSRAEQVVKALVFCNKQMSK